MEEEEVPPSMEEENEGGQLRTVDLGEPTTEIELRRVGRILTRSTTIVTHLVSIVRCSRYQS